MFSPFRVSQMGKFQVNGRMKECEVILSSNFDKVHIIYIILLRLIIFGKKKNLIFATS